VTPRASRATAEPAHSTRPSSRVSVKHTARKRTPQKDFRPHLLAILQEHGGRLDRDDLLAQVQERLDGVLLDGDREQTETGEVRWHATVRFERKAMVDDGLLVPAQAGLWQLTPEGSDAAAE
jgi:hypothetical protein